MQHPWEVRPKQEKGSDNYDSIFVQVGRALTAWETAESHMAELFDALVASQPSNRAAFSAFVAVKTSSARTDLLAAAFDRAVGHGDPAREDVSDLIEKFGKFGARRNEIAHGRVYDLAEYGYYLGPNNTMPNKWRDGAAKFQYTADDVEFYGREFAQLAANVRHVTEALVTRNIAASNTRRAKSSQTK